MLMDFMLYDGSVPSTYELFCPRRSHVRNVKQRPMLPITTGKPCSYSHTHDVKKVDQLVQGAATEVQETHRCNK